VDPGREPSASKMPSKSSGFVRQESSFDFSDLKALPEDRRK
jgi:hypothetical protein